MSLDAMKQALEALCDFDYDKRQSAITALRAAIEQAEQPLQWQGLTKREFLEAVEGLEDLEDCWVAIQAKLKEKNT